MLTTAPAAAIAGTTRLKAVRMAISFEDVAVLALSGLRGLAFPALGLASNPHPR